MSASARGFIEVVRSLLDNNADVNAKDTRGSTALSDAALEGRLGSGTCITRRQGSKSCKEISAEVDIFTVRARIDGVHRSRLVHQ
jgi:hypothetical protein